MYGRMFLPSPRPLARLSVIVSGRAPLPHLRACLESITGQAYEEECGGPEVVVTAPQGDPEACALVEAHALRDPRLTVVPVPPDTPAAHARAAALRAATGAYVQFLSPSDRLPDGAASALARRLDRHRDDPPDVLLCDHHRATWWDDALPGGDAPVLTRPHGAPATAAALADRPDLLDVAPVLGSRLIAASLLAAHPELAGTDGHDELYLSYAVLLLARTVACCDTPAVVHRAERPAQRRAAGPGRHFAVLAQYERLHRLAAAASAPPGVRTRLYDRMVADYLRTLAGRDELAPADAAAYFRRAAEHTARFRPEGHRGPGGLDGVRHLLLGRRAHLCHQLLLLAQDGGRALRTATDRQAGRAAAARVRLRYRRSLRRPLDEDLAVFSAHGGRGLHGDPAAIAAELAELAPDVRSVRLVDADRVPLLPPGTDHAVTGTARAWDVLARAKYLITDTDFPDEVVKRPGSVHLQTHHGTPLTYTGVDLRHLPAAARGVDFDALLARADRWDYNLSANRHSTETWQRAYPSGFRTLPYGSPRNDVLYRATAADVRAARQALGVPPGALAVLYAPTHRDHAARRAPHVDLARLAARLGGDTVLLVRTDEPVPRDHPRIVDVARYEPAARLLLAADVLVTDHASLLCDYANLDRPIVVHADDRDLPTATRGLYADIAAEPPGPVTRTDDELADVLGPGGEWCGEAAAKLRHDFRLRFCQYDDGRAAERVVRRVFLGEGEESLPPVLPLDRRTPAPTPQEAGHR
ncbi:CDP-glycerol glycerophosphotransferase family protein [Streptomyces sp. TRM64462]|uniref:CDP-glycerol glycerophosphotransferase family protein n=1 Tax=Streptomyces sp. TRM64462 TaxID=2741726 RepID=UPI0020C80696|nr:CDP-glycerol glycerophosphotransferase family protein [Streptomyces sp. TRM64462]